jgi:succinate dehydrogenase hydrophobic anchor subunit
MQAIRNNYVTHSTHRYISRKGGRTPQYRLKCILHLCETGHNDIDELESENRFIQRVSGVTRFLSFFFFFFFFSTLQIQQQRIIKLPAFRPETRLTISCAFVATFVLFLVASEAAMWHRRWRIIHVNQFPLG